VIAVFGVISGFSPNLAFLLISRALVGFGVGGQIVAYDLLAEMLPSKNRGKCLLSISFFWTAGSVLISLSAWMFLDSKGWRLLIFIASIPVALSVIVSYLFLPESPRWLVVQGRLLEAKDVLYYCAKVNGTRLDHFHLSDENSSSQPQGNESKREVQAAQQMTSANESALLIDRLHAQSHSLQSACMYFFSPSHRKVTLCLWLLWFTFGFNYVGIILFVSKIFEHDTSTASTNTCEFEYTSIFINSFSECAGLAIAMITIDSCGRISSQLIGYGLAGVSLLLLAFGFLGHSSLISISFIARMLIFGTSTISWESTPELLSTEFRTTGHALCASVHRLGSFLVPFIINQKEMSNFRISMVLTSINICSMIAVSQLPETKG
jgi:MFS family permease